MDTNHTQETTMSFFKGYLKCADGTVAYSSAAYYTTEADALASAERTAAKKAVKYGRTYTAYAIGRGVLSAPGRTFGPEGEVFADDDYADCTCGHREAPTPDGCQCLPEETPEDSDTLLQDGQPVAEVTPRTVASPLPTVNTVKKCSRCAEVKSVADFAHNRSSKDGLYSQCKACESAARKLKAALKEAIHHGTPEQIAAASHAYRDGRPAEEHRALTLERTTDDKTLRQVRRELSGLLDRQDARNFRRHGTRRNASDSRPSEAETASEVKQAVGFIKARNAACIEAAEAREAAEERRHEGRVS